MTPCNVAPEIAATNAKSVEIVRSGLLALPFLSPLVAGPSVVVWQSLVTAACVAGLLISVRVAGLGTPLLMWLLAGALTVSVSALSSGMPSTLAALFAIAGVGAMAFVGSGALREGLASTKSLAAGVVVAGLASSVIGLLQYYGHAEWLVPWTTSPALGQSYGNLRQRNQFATLISMAWVAVLAPCRESDCACTARVDGCGIAVACCRRSFYIAHRIAAVAGDRWRGELYRQA